MASVTCKASNRKQVSNKICDINNLRKHEETN